MQPPSTHVDDWNLHWSRYAGSAEQNPAQAYRRALVFERLGLDAARRPARVLELGCGQGDLSREITERWPDVELLGLDISDTGIEVARQKVPGGTFIQADFMQPLRVPEQYRGWATHAICTEVLEHVDEPSTVLEHARATLAPGARLVITVPAGPMSAFDKHIGHRRHFTLEGLAATITSAGLEVETIHGAGFPFFNLYRLVVIARGRKLVQDAATQGPMPPAAQIMLRTFSWLFRWNRAETTRGWQLVAVARAPG